jgi:hypothetical protein
MTQEEILDPEKFSAKSAKMDVNSRKKIHHQSQNPSPTRISDQIACVIN